MSTEVLLADVIFDVSNVVQWTLRVTLGCVELVASLISQNMVLVEAALGVVLASLVCGRFLPTSIRSSVVLELEMRVCIAARFVNHLAAYGRVFLLLIA